MTRRARLHDLLEHPMDGADIESRSFAHIDQETGVHHFTPAQWEVVRRMIHTTGDFAITDHVIFSDDAVSSAVSALKGRAAILTDANMAKSGISMARLCSANGGYTKDDLHCYVADEDVAKAAETRGLPRSVVAMEKAAPILDGAIVAIGNAPTALMALSRMIMEENVRPALVIGVPVGFVHVAESKEELMGLSVPHIVLAGNRGGSPITVAIIHALCTLAAQDKKKRAGFDTVILLGHGSRVQGADQSMLKVAAAVRETGRYGRVETCNMSRLGPHFGETYEGCVAAGAKNVLVLPYFLNQGMHMKLDIPEMMQAAAKAHPDIKLVFGKNLGFDPLLVQLTEKRIQESAGCPDVREMALPEESDFPVPEGQGEFVEMPPDVAEKWRKANA